MNRVVVPVLLTLLVGLLLLLTGCGKTKYKVKADDLFKGVKSSYEGGEEVRITYDLIATDTNYTFYVDGKSVNAEYSEQDGYVITFTMPNHDVEVTCETRNTMTADTEPTEANTEKKAEADGSGLSAAEKKQDDEKTYEEILNHYYRLGGDPEHFPELKEEEMEFEQLINTYSGKQNLDYMGYTFLDLDGDGKNELLLGFYQAPDQQKGPAGNHIIVGYTVKAEKPELFLNGWSRNNYFLLKDGTLLNKQSSGAMYSALGIYKLDPKEKCLSCQDFYFTREKDETFEEAVVYHSQDDLYDLSTAELTDLTLEDYYKLHEEKEAEIANIQWKKLSDYAYSGEAFTMKEAAGNDAGKTEEDSQATLGEGSELLKIQLLDEEAIPENALFYEADSENFYGVPVCFTALDGVKDLRISFLTLDYYGDSFVVYNAEDLKYWDGLKRGEQLVVRMALPEILERYCISYRDSKGREYNLAVTVSGEDGHIYLHDVTGYVNFDSTSGSGGSGSEEEGYVGSTFNTPYETMQGSWMLFGTYAGGGEVDEALNVTELITLSPEKTAGYSCSVGGEEPFTSWNLSLEQTDRGIRFEVCMNGGLVDFTILGVNDAGDMMVFEQDYLLDGTYQETTKVYMKRY